ncbi:hypothetical protein FPE01S_03_03000 [Flavihumibacter petaseus NBRC 106054]|uniref:Oxidoreductase n=2 Tax=Flavihumibacter TaxID=1004301 RepID=A0A0E9N2N0_9BACT|nr:hypothetical protein FPE01S_03_03000 [Flavihumibacter petaseus NBRC 106054]
MDRSLKVTLLEKSSKLLSKVRISGGGRCNVTHACFQPGMLVKKYPRGEKFLLKAFRHFGPEDTIGWFRDRQVELKTEADGRMFPVTDDSGTIIQCLLREADRWGVEIRMQEEVKQLEMDGGRWKVRTSREVLQADAVCVATGGFTKKEHFGWLEAVGHTALAPVPSLFTFNLPGHPITQLMGVVKPEARVKLTGSKLEETGPVLITHWGLSGPAVLRLSAWGARELALKQWHFRIVVNWTPEYHENSLLEYLRKFREGKGAQKIANRNPVNMPQRLWDYFLGLAGADSDLRWADLPAKKLNLLCKLLTSQEMEVSGKTTFKEEFVTAGGINLAEIDPETMESRLCEGLYFAGEIMDVDGITGGFNFQHAWTSGMLAAMAVSAGQEGVKK